MDRLRWSSPYEVSWYFERGRRGQLRFPNADTALMFAERMKATQRPLVLVTQFKGDKI